MRDAKYEARFFLAGMEVLSLELDDLVGARSWTGHPGDELVITDWVKRPVARYVRGHRGNWWGVPFNDDRDAVKAKRMHAVQMAIERAGLDAPTTAMVDEIFAHLSDDRALVRGEPT